MTRKLIILVALTLALAAFVGCRSAHVTSAILYIDQATLPMYQKAIAVLHEGLEYSPDEAEAFFYLGEAHSMVAEVAINDNDYIEAKKNYQMAYDYYRRAEDLEVEITERVDESLLYNYTGRMNDARNEFTGGYFEAAEGYFRLAYAALPDSLGPLKNIARMKIRMAADNANDPAMLGEALDLIEEVLQTHPEAYDLLSDKARVLGLLDRADEANRIYEDLLAEHGDDTDLLLDIAELSTTETNFERAAEMYVRVADIYEHDDDITNDPEIYHLRLQAGRFFGRREVARYGDALSNLDAALRLEDMPQKNTMEDKLQAHYDYGTLLKAQRDEEADEARKAELNTLMIEQFTAGKNVGETLVNSFFDSKWGYFYLAQCYNELGDIEGFQRNFELYQGLSGGA